MQELVCIADINTDVAKACRLTVYDDVIETYADPETLSKLPPPEAVYNGIYYFLWDGFHRYCAQQKAGHDHILMEVTKGSQRDAELKSFGANAAHGIHRTKAAKRRLVERMLDDDEWKKLSHRDIAKHCRVSPGLVDRIVKDRLEEAESQMEESAESEHSPAYIGSEHCPARPATASTRQPNQQPITSEVSAATEPTEPWHEFEVQIHEVQSELRSTAAKLRDALEYDSESKQIRSKWGAFYSAQGTVGLINQFIRELDKGLPVELCDGKPGYRNERNSIIAKRTAA